MGACFLLPPCLFDEAHFEPRGKKPEAMKGSLQIKMQLKHFRLKMCKASKPTTEPKSELNLRTKNLQLSLYLKTKSSKASARYPTGEAAHRHGFLRQRLRGFW